LDRPFTAFTRSRRRTGAVVLALCGLVGSLAACAGDDDDSASQGSAEPGPSTAAPTTVERPDGPAADLSEELTGGEGVFVASARPAELGDTFVQEEFVAAGRATSYEADGELAGDGRWTFTAGTPADYRTRVLVRRPADAADFSGTVVVEWLNVSGGADADPDWVMTYEEILRRGHAWVGVSAQRIGVEGGPVAVSAPGGEGIAGEGLKGIDPERYGSLSHPGDGYAFDIYSQVARALRAGAGLGDLEPRFVLAIGESQSAIALVTYANGVQPLTRAFDGFLVHSRGGTGLPLVGPGEYADIAASIGGAPVTFRTDLTVPILDVQTEGDVAGVLGSLEARQPDTERFRLWEVAGTAHADTRLVGPVAERLDCGAPINDGPAHVVVKAALRALDTWVRTGEAPAEADRLELTEGAAPAIARDGDGIALGGVRTPPVDVPVEVLSGDPGPAASVICILLGTTQPLPADRLAALYDSRTDYEERYDAAIDTAVEAGFVLHEDRDGLLEYAHPERIAE
jgi:hypothetical protein